MSSYNEAIGLPRSIPHFREVGTLTEGELSQFSPVQRQRVAALNEVDRRLDWLLYSVDVCKAAHNGKPFERALGNLTDALLDYRAALEAVDEERSGGAQPDEHPGHDESARAGAIELGRRRNQVSIWDNAAEVAIPTGGTGEFLP